MGAASTFNDVLRQRGRPARGARVKLAPSNSGGQTGGVWIGGPDRPNGSVPAFADGQGDEAEAARATGTSIFDPVLTELAYRWFCPAGGRVLDPFAGGSVRGIVAAALGRHYVGVDLRPEQVAANFAQWADIGAKLGGTQPAPVWHVGDSAHCLAPGAAPDVGDAFDFVFSCPPYGDLEIYSDDAADLSNMPHADFVEAYRAIIAASVARLAPDRFAAFVVGEYRCKRGFYRNFVGETVAAFEAAGARFYNEAILVTAIGSLPVRIARQFAAGRKLGKTHQQLLCFVKGSPERAAQACEALAPTRADAEAPTLPEALDMPILNGTHAFGFDDFGQGDLFGGGAP